MLEEVSQVRRLKCGDSSAAEDLPVGFLKIREGNDATCVKRRFSTSPLQRGLI